jgi:hypothetical protein
MPNQFIKMGEETLFALSSSQNSKLTSIDDYINFCKVIYENVKVSGGGNVDLASKSTEFHYFGVTGAPNGEILAPMLWSISHFPKFFATAINASTGLVIGSATELLLASDVLETVYTANHSSLPLLKKALDTDSVNNITTLTWDTIKNEMPQVDFAQVVVNYFADNDIFDAVTNSIKPGGLLIVSNSSNGGELYQEFGEDSFAHQIHDRLKSTQKFDIMHMQGYISYTLCVRKLDF